MTQSNNSSLTILANSLFSFRFDFLKNKWTEIAPMSIARNAFAHVVLSDRIFVFGGRNETGRSINSVEYFKQSTNEWQTVSPMRHVRAYGSACAPNGFIYVLGGVVGSGVHQSIERYDPGENAWTEVSLTEEEEWLHLKILL